MFKRRPECSASSGVGLSYWSSGQQGFAGELPSISLNALLRVSHTLSQPFVFFSVAAR
jgi:hypothetical protein